MSFGKRLKQLRLERDITQLQLSKVLDTAKSNISKYEADIIEPNISMLRKLGKYFNVSVDYLLGITDNKNVKASQLKESDTSFSERLNTLIKDDRECDINFYSQVSRIPIDNFKKYVSGEAMPSAYDMCKIVESLDTSADYLFGFADDPHPPHLHNNFSEDRFPAIMSIEMDGNYLETELAEELNLPISAIKALLSGDKEPDSNLLYQLAQIFHKSTDYLLGITKESRKKDKYNDEYPFKFDLETSKHISKLMESYGSDIDWKIVLSISDFEVYLLKKYGFVSHISILCKVADILHLSLDHLLGRTGATIILEKSEEPLLLAFRKLNTENQSIAYGDLLKVKKQQEQEEYIKASSIATDNNLRTGTDKLGK